MPAPDPEFSRLPTFSAGKVKVAKFQLFSKKLQNRKGLCSQLYLMIFALRATFRKGSQPALFTDVANRKHFCSVPTFPKRSGKRKSRKVCSRPTFLNDFADFWNVSIYIAKVTFWDIPDSKSPHEKTTRANPSISLHQEHSFYALGRPCVSKLLKRSVPGAARSHGMRFCPSGAIWAWGLAGDPECQPVDLAAPGTLRLSPFTLFGGREA